MVAITRMRPPQLGHFRTSTSNTRCSKSAQSSFLTVLLLFFSGESSSNPSRAVSSDSASSGQGSTSGSGTTFDRIFARYSAQRWLEASHLASLRAIGASPQAPGCRDSARERERRHSSSLASSERSLASSERQPPKGASPPRGRRACSQGFQPLARRLRRRRSFAPGGFLAGGDWARAARRHRGAGHPSTAPKDASLESAL